MLKPHRICIIVLLLLILPGLCWAGDKKKVLLLNSYHQGYKWTDDVVKGALTGLYPLSNSTEVFIEYMGTKWAFSPEYFEQLRQLYKKKYSETRFDVIISSDDDAFNFLKKYRNEIFGEVPMVFCGVNWIKPERFKDVNLCTGVNEDGDVAANLDLMLRLHPQTRDIYVVIDATTTGQATLKKLEETAPAYRNRIKINILYDLDMPSLIRKLTTLDEHSLVLTTVFQRDHSGRFFEYKESCRLISQNSSVPVYGLWDFNLGSGIIGGILCSGHSQGLIAGKMALRILKGEAPNTITPVMVSPNLYMFDYLQIKRFGLKTTALPADSIVINKPTSFYSINKRIVWAFSAIFAVLLSVIALLVINIRKRYLAESAAHESEHQYHSLVDNLTLGVYRGTADAQGRILSANPAMLKIFGYDSIEDFAGVPIVKQYRNAEQRQAYLDDITRLGYVKDRELAMQKKDGSPLWVMLNARAQFDENGLIKWIDGIAEDITEKKKLDDKLRQAQKMEAIGTLASGIAHDFNNILTGIIGYGELAMEELSDTQTAQSHLHEVLTAADRARDLVRQILTFSRRVETEVTAIEPHLIVKEALKLLRASIPSTIVIQTAIEASGTILADPSQLHQIIMNLCTNAYAAMPKGGVLTMKLNPYEISSAEHESGLAPGRYIMISVGDNGIGMDAGTLQHIFEPFFTTKPKGEGTGLGLSTVHGIVKSLKGEISVYSEPGLGTTFHVYLPRCDSQSCAVTEAVGSQITGHGELILLVDDELALLSLGSHILTKLGYSVKTAASPEEALVIFANAPERFSVVITDYAMPHMNGTVLAEELPKIRANIPIVLTSGFSPDLTEKWLKDVGISHFIQKPYKMQAFASALTQILKSENA